MNLNCGSWRVLVAAADYLALASTQLGRESLHLGLNVTDELLLVLTQLLVLLEALEHFLGVRHIFKTFVVSI